MKFHSHNFPADFRRALYSREPIGTAYGEFTINATTGYGLPLVPVFVRTSTGVYCTLAVGPYAAPPNPEVNGMPVYIPALDVYGCVDAHITETLYLYPKATTWTRYHKEDTLLYVVSGLSGNAGLC